MTTRATVDQISRRRPEAPMPQSTPDLTAVCDLCADVVSPRDGYLWVDLAEVSRVTQQVEAWEIEHPASEPMTGENLRTRPQVARWRVTHTSCEPGPRESRYDIELDRIVSFRDLAGWTLHLMQKPWLRHTDWDELAEAALGGRSGRLTSAYADPWDA
jgi:hypothetical protein